MRSSQATSLRLSFGFGSLSTNNGNFLEQAIWGRPTAWAIVTAGD